MLTAMRSFVEALFYDPSNTPWDLKAFLLGTMAMQDPKDRVFVTNREQDREKLHKIGRKGMPLMVLGAREDKMVNTAVVASLMEPHFRDMEVAWVEERGSHACFYDNVEETMLRISGFVHRVVT